MFDLKSFLQGLTHDLENRMVTDDRTSEEDEPDCFALKQGQCLRLKNREEQIERDIYQAIDNCLNSWLQDGLSCC